MFVNSLRVFQITAPIKTVFRAQISTGAALKEKWDLLAAVCLERKPVITPALNELEQEYKELMSSVENENSLKSDFDLRHEADHKQLEKLNKGAVIDDSEGHLKQTAQDLLDSWTEELSKFKVADRITDADKKNDLKSLNRKLDKHLILIVNQEIGDKKHYLLPQDVRKSGETLRQTAERVLKQFCGSEIKTQIYGNAPCGFYKYKYPLDIRNKNEVVGAKVFIYFARYLKGDIPKEGNVDYKWLDKVELEKTLQPQYNKAVSQMLFDD